jgi:hypothetical protein
MDISDIKNKLFEIGVNCEGSHSKLQSRLYKVITTVINILEANPDTGLGLSLGLGSPHEPNKQTQQLWQALFESKDSLANEKEKRITDLETIISLQKCIISSSSNEVKSRVMVQEQQTANGLQSAAVSHSLTRPIPTAS